MNSPPKVIIVGIVRNCEKSFLKEYKKLLNACVDLQIIDSFFVESDSSDKTVNLLTELSKQMTKLNFDSLGDIRDRIPNRIERIRYCRNHYVSFLRNNYSQNMFEYVIVADMDGINSTISKFAINSCFNYFGWDALFSNQFLGYSDLLALRASGWVENDFLIELEEARKQLRNSPNPKSWLGKLKRYFEYDQTRKTYIYDKMKFLGFQRKLIPVKSAFGGIAIYRSWCFYEADYSTELNIGECEHVSFHKKLILQNANLYINTRLINSILNTYNANKYFLIRNVRLWRWNLAKKG